MQKQKIIHEALCDSFNTSQVLQELLNLITNCNIYVKECSEQKDKIMSAEILDQIGRYVAHILDVFGLSELSTYLNKGNKAKEEQVSCFQFLETPKFKSTLTLGHSHIKISFFLTFDCWRHLDLRSENLHLTKQVKNSN